MKAVERGEADKAAAVLSKKGIIPTKLDVEGRSAWVTHTHLHTLELEQNMDETLHTNQQ